MSTTVQELTTTIAAVTAKAIKDRLHQIAAQNLQGNDAGMQAFNLIGGWLDQAIAEVSPGVASLTVPFTGQPQAGGYVSQAVAGIGAPLGAAPSTPFAQAGGLSQFAGVAPQAPGGGNLPANGVRSLAEVGKCRVPRHESPNGAKCGFCFTTKTHPGQTFYCTVDATKLNENCGLWSCNKHKNNKSGPDGRGGGKKSSAISGTPLVSAQQIQGLRTPTQSFGGNPAMNGHLAQVMGQQPAMPNPFGAVPAAGGVGSQLQAPSNMQLSAQLMNSTQNQLGAVPPQQIAPSGAAVNMSNLMAGQPPAAVNIQQPSPAAAPSPFGGHVAQPSPFGGQVVQPSPFGQITVQQTAASPFGGHVAQPSPFGGQAAAPSPFGGQVVQPSPFGQITVQQTAASPSAFDDDDGHGGSDSDEDEEEHVDVYVPVTDANALSAALAAAQPTPFSQAPVPFGGAASTPMTQPAPAAAAPNPLAAAMSAAQQPPPAAAPTPATDVNAMLQGQAPIPFGGAPPATQQPAAAAPNPLAAAMAAATSGQ